MAGSGVCTNARVRTLSGILDILHNMVREWGTNITVGMNNQIDDFCLIGGQPQYKNYTGPTDGPIRIGNDNVIREFTNIHRPIRDITSVGDRNYIQSHVHIAHDCVVHDDTVLATGVILGGHVVVCSRAYLGFGTLVHPRVYIGEYAMLGMGSIVARDVPPFALMRNNIFADINRIGMERAGMKSDEINRVRQIYKSLPPTDPHTWYERTIYEFYQRPTQHKGPYLPGY